MEQRSRIFAYIALSLSKGHHPKEEHLSFCFLLNAQGLHPVACYSRQGLIER